MAPAPVMPYTEPGQHLSDLLVLVRLFLQRHLVLYTDRYLDSAGENTSRFVSRREVDALLSMEAPPPEIADQIATVEETISLLRSHITARLEASADAGFRFPTEDLRAAFNLTEVQVDCLVALAAPEIDQAFFRAYAHAWADLTRRHMDLGFLMDLVAGNGPRREEVWDALSPGSPLVRWGFVEVGLLPEQPSNVRFSERPLKAADRIVNWMRGRRSADPVVLGTVAEYMPPLASAEGFSFPPATTATLIEAFRYLEKAPSRPAGVCLVGAPGVGRKTLVRTVLAGQGRPVLVLQLTRVPAEEQSRRRCLRELVAESLLLDAVLYLEGIEYLTPLEAGHPVLADLHDLLTAERATVVIGTSIRIDRILNAMGDFMAIEVPFPETAEQVRLWDAGLKAATRVPLDFQPRELASRYSVSPGVIQSCCADVARWSQTAGRKAKKIPTIVVVESIRRKLEHRLSSLALPVQKGESWDDLVLPKRTIDLLHEIVSFFQHRHRILRDFGLGNKLLKSPGIPCLFAGPPGTGKTMAAAIIAKEIGREVFQVDLSRVVDKYIGETEKNLSRIFEEGGRAQAVLLFDEADSLFAKRTEVKSSVDRYANLEVNFLLQRVESYEGVTVLTSNFATSIDDAFKRRLRFWVDFPFPEQEERVKLWKVLMPSEVPVAGPLDFEELAERYVVSGGHIRNIIIRAATLAAELDRPIDMDMLHRAGDMEYRVMGKLVREEREEETPTPPRWSA